MTTDTKGEPGDQMGEGFYLPQGYRINSVPITHDAHSGVDYWTPPRIRATESFQFSVYKYACSVASERAATTILDVGCGVGRKLQLLHDALPQARIVGIDQESAVAHCRSHLGFGEWYQDDFEKPRLDLAIQAQVVISADVIEHLANPDHLLSYIKARLAPKGVVILSTPDRQRLWGKGMLRSPNPSHVREWNASEFAAYVTSRGFRLLKHFHQLPVKLEASRLFAREVVRRFVQGKAIYYNQVCLLKSIEQ